MGRQMADSMVPSFTPVQRKSGGSGFSAARLDRRALLRRAFHWACSATTATLVTRVAGADESDRHVPPFEDAIVIAGTARERGRQYGRRFADAIRAFLDREIYAPFVSSLASKDELFRYADACGKVVRAQCPIIADELEGMAEGSGLRLEEHLLLTLHEELYHRGVLPPISHCTAVAVGQPQTAGRTTYVGQTWDWMQSVAGLSRMLHWRRAEGPDLLAYAFPGLWVGAGLNAAGLALCWTSAALGQPNQMPRVGLPSYVLLTHLLYQESLDAVREAAQRDAHAGWFTFVMADGTGRLMNIEGSPDGIEVVETTGRLVRAGFGTRRMSQSPDDASVPRHPRCAALDSKLDKVSGRIDLRTLQEAFADPQGGICAGPGTIDMMVFNTTDRVAHASRGGAYGVAWRAYQMPAS
jgi:hypothetical protein